MADAVRDNENKKAAKAVEEAAKEGTTTAPVAPDPAPAPTKVPDGVVALKRDRVRVTENQDEDINTGRPARATPNVVPQVPVTNPTGTSAGQVETQTAKKDQTIKFLEITGYKVGDIIASNADRRTFVTSNGGKYELSPKGTRVRILSGPNPPGQAEKEGEDE